GSNTTTLHTRREANMSTNQAKVSGVRFAELLAALSLAIDLGLGQPMQKFHRTCLLAVRLGKLLGVSSEDLAALYYLGLIQHLGCTAYADDAAAIFGDDIEANTWLFTTDLGNPGEMLRLRAHRPSPYRTHLQ